MATKFETFVFNQVSDIAPKAAKFMRGKGYTKEQFITEFSSGALQSVMYGLRTGGYSEAEAKAKLHEMIDNACDYYFPENNNISVGG